MTCISECLHGARPLVRTLKLCTDRRSAEIRCPREVGCCLTEFACRYAVVQDCTEYQSQEAGRLRASPGTTIHAARTAIATTGKPFSVACNAIFSSSLPCGQQNPTPFTWLASIR
jgi:hypothetical protein